ncbi:hypothetical protein [Nocardia asteroides]|uniref:hypothetical protein n=1 Tax=Nocardia asteroides TaxID=1824 RepID=UPI001E4EBA10|nr:hypothetical protein [Nocardia asteroides]UGT60317.1 hypothetical protein LTT61_24415 [Nocardia asteroides]
MDSEHLDLPTGASARLAALLTRRAGVAVEVDAGGPDGARTVRWIDGPTVAQLTELVAELREDELPRPGTLNYEHRPSSHGRAVTALLWLDEAPERCGLHEAVIADRAERDIGCPELAEHHWQRRAGALLSLGPGGQRFTLTALRLLLEVARTYGWAAGLTWLDTNASAPRTRLRVVR